MPSPSATDERKTRRRTAAWSTPYYGLTHLHGLKPGYQVTVHAHERYATVHVFYPQAHYFTRAREYRCNNVDEAKLLGTQLAEEADAFKEPTQ